MTCHKAQGQTCQITLVAAGPAMTRQTTYTALSRGRLANHLYLAPDRDGGGENLNPLQTLQLIQPALQLQLSPLLSLALQLLVRPGTLGLGCLQHLFS